MAGKTNASATIYNYYKRPDSKIEYRPTVLSAVHWENNKAVNVIASGLTTADAVNLMIWFDVDAQERKYLKPKEYARLSPDEAYGHWTITQGQDRIVKGTIENAAVLDNVKSIVDTYDDVITVKSADTVDYGPRSAHHWEVSGS